MTDDMNDYDVVSEAERIASDAVDRYETLSSNFLDPVSELFPRAAIEIYERIGRKLTVDEAEDLFNEMVQMSVGASLWYAWERGFITMGWRDGEITWWPNDE